MGVIQVNGPVTGACIADGSCSPDAALRFIDWVEPLLRRESYLALLAERPEVQRRLLRLLGLARWPMQYLMRHPGVIDELADARLQHQRFDRAAFQSDLEERHAAWVRAGEADEEVLLDTLRHAHHAEVFRTLVRDVEGDITVEQVADDLSALADAVLDTTIAWAWARLRQRHREAPQFGVINADDHHLVIGQKFPSNRLPEAELVKNPAKLGFIVH